VEVEYYNKGKAYEAPNDYMITQVVMTGPDGVFTYATPWAGWWASAALTEGPQKLKHDGADKPVEMGAVLWT
jgi:cobalt/nickel transport protein